MISDKDLEKFRESAKADYESINSGLAPKSSGSLQTNIPYWRIIILVDEVRRLQQILLKAPNEERLKHLEYCETRSEVLEKMRVELGNELAAKQLALEEAVEMLEEWTASRLFNALLDNEQKQIRAKVVLLKEAIRGTGLGDAFASQLKEWKKLYDSVNKELGKSVSRLASYKRAYRSLAQVFSNLPTEEWVAAKNAVAEIQILERKTAKEES